MIEAGNDFRLALEALAACGVARKIRGENLDRDRTVQAGILRAIHFTHAAGTERRDDLVWA